MWMGRRAQGAKPVAPISDGGLTHSPVIDCCAKIVTRHLPIGGLIVDPTVPLLDDIRRDRGGFRRDALVEYGSLVVPGRCFVRIFVRPGNCDDVFLPIRAATHLCPKERARY